MFMFTIFIPQRFYDAAGSGAGSGTGSGPSSTSAASPTAASTPAGQTTPASATGTGTSSTQTPTQTQAQDPTQQATQTQTQTPATDDLTDGNWRELRSRYEAQKAELATLKTPVNPQVAATITRAQEMAKTLGYQDQDFLEAFAKDPIKTIAILNAEMVERQPQGQGQGQGQGPDGQGPDLNKQIEDLVNAKLSPIQAEHNRQATDVAYQKYEQTVDQLVKADPILKDAPDEIVSIVKDYLGEYFSTQPNILIAMKTKGDFSMVPDAVKFVAGRLHSGFKAWLAKGQGTSTSTTGPAASRPNGKLTLDQIIDDPSVLGDAYK